MAGNVMTDQAVILQQAAQGIGMNVELQRMPKDGYWSNIWTKKPFSIGNINPRPSPDVLFTLFFKSDSPFNETGWKNERFDSPAVAGTRRDRRAEAQGDVLGDAADHP